MHGLDDAKLGPDDPLTPFSEPPTRRARAARWWLLALLVATAVALLLAQGLDAGSVTRRLVAAWLADVRDPRWGPLYVLGAFSVGALVFAPITAMFLATSFALSPGYGFAYCLLGGLWGGSLAYAIGRALGARPLARFTGPRLRRLSREVQKRPRRSVLVARFLPVGNFTLVNLLLGSLRVPYYAFALGTLTGMVPGVLAITLCKGLLERVLEAPSVTNVALLVGGLSAAAGLLYLAARRIARQRRASLALERTEEEA